MTRILARAVPLAVVALATLACGGLSGSGTRVAIVRAGGIDPDIDTQVARGVGQILRDRGFLVTLVDDPIDGDDLDMAARYAASGVGAANAVVLDLQADAVRPGVLDGTELHQVQLVASVVNLDPELDVVRQRLAFASEDTSPLPVERRTQQHWIEATGGFAVRHLFVTPEVGGVMMGEQVPMEEMSAANELRKRERQVAEAAERAYRYEAWCEEEQQRVAAFADDGVTCVGDPCGGTSILGVVGDRVIAQDARRVLWFGVPVGKDPTWSEPPERILSLPIDGGQETVLVTAQNLYGLGHADDDAQVITADWFSSEHTEAIVAIDVDSGERVRTALLGTGERSTFAQAAPDGSTIAYCLRDGGGCFLHDDDGRQSTIPLDEAGWVHTGDGPRLFTATERGIAAVAVDGTVIRGRLPGTLYAVLGAQDGRVFLVTRDDGECSYVSLDAAALDDATTSPLPSCPWQPDLHPDGGLVAVADAAQPDDVPGDAEVVRWSPGDEAWTVLTRGTDRDERPYATASGKVVFNRRLPPAPAPYDTEIYRRLVCTVATP